MFTQIFKGMRKNPDLGISLRRKVLGWSHFEGGLWAAMVGCSETFAVYHAVKKGLTSSEVALITTLPILVGALANWITPGLIKQKFIKHALLAAVGIQILGILGCVLSVDAENYFLWSLISLILYMTGGTLASPLWVDWMSVWLPDDRMSRYLARRNGFTALVTVCSYLAAAFILHRDESTMVYRIVFIFALICRCISWIILYLQPQAVIQEKSKRMRSEEPAKISLLFGSQALLIMVLLTAAFRFVQNFASPFFLPYMVNDLKFSMLDYAWITAVPFLAKAIFLAPWGEAVRAYRPYIALQIAMVLLSINCLLWTFSTNIFALTFIETMSGMAWGGFELAVILIMHNFKPGQARGLIGFHSSFQHSASIIGGLTGAKMIESGFQNTEMFTLSGFMRLTVAILFIVLAFKLKETRVKLKVYGEFVMAAMSLRPQRAALARFIPERIRRVKPLHPETQKK